MPSFGLLLTSPSAAAPSFPFLSGVPQAEQDHVLHGSIFHGSGNFHALHRIPGNAPEFPSALLFAPMGRHGSRSTYL